MITIDGLTAAQVAMCERVWACKEIQDFERLCNGLMEEDRRMAITLMEIMLQECSEEELENMEVYSDAEMLLSKVRGG